MTTVTATTAPDFAGPSRPLPRLVDAPGTTLELLVLAAHDRYCAGIDLDSGALVRAWAERPPNVPLRSYDKAVITLGGYPERLPDPSQPEALVARGAPEATGRVRKRRAERLQRPLVHPDDAPLLGSHAPSIPFWERRRDHPSVALVEPQGQLVVQRFGASMACQFGWRTTVITLPCIDRRLAAALERWGPRMVGAAHHYRLLIALEPPVDGHCHKVVEAILSRD